MRSLKPELPPLPTAAGSWTLSSDGREYLPTAASQPAQPENKDDATVYPEITADVRP